MGIAMSADSERLLPPNDPAAFESLCLDLLKDIWGGDAGAQKNGRSGQSQAGVDLFGRCQGKWMGVQCKQKDGLLRTKVTKTDLEREVKAALRFEPRLSLFILATSGPRDAKIQNCARKLTDAHERRGLFKVEVWSWEDIWHEIYQREALLKCLKPIYWPRLSSLDVHVEIAPTRLRHGAERLFGREDDLKRIDAAWEDPMGYRVALAQDHDRDLPRATALQENLVAWNRLQAAPALALPPDAALDPDQHYSIRTLAVSVEALGQTLSEQSSPGCVAAYEESIQHYQRVQDTVAEATSRHNLGVAYLSIAAIRNLDAAEASYQRSLAAWAETDFLNRSKTIKEIGMVHHERFRQSRQRGEPAETVLKHAKAAEQHYYQALALCPPTALTELGPFRNQFGNLCQEIGQTEPARKHYEIAARCFEQTGNRYGAGRVRVNMALMYFEAAGQESAPPRRGDLLHRARAYAQASLRDFQRYQGRAADKVADAQQLLARIAQALESLDGGKEKQRKCLCPYALESGDCR